MRYVLAAAVVLAACGGSSDRHTARARPGQGVVDDDQICRDEAPTGTILTRPVCRSRMQSEEDRQRAMELMSRPKGMARRGQ
jgi:hypothetical protein